MKSLNVISSLHWIVYVLALLHLVFTEICKLCNGEDFTIIPVNVGDDFTLECNGSERTDSFRFSKQKHQTNDTKDNDDYFAFYTELEENFPKREVINDHTLSTYVEDVNGTSSLHLSFIDVSYNDSSIYTCFIAGNRTGYKKTTTFHVRVLGCTCSFDTCSSHNHLEVNTVTCNITGLRIEEQDLAVRLCSLHQGVKVNMSGGSFTYPLESEFSTYRSLDIRLDQFSNITAIRCVLPESNEEMATGVIVGSVISVLIVILVCLMSRHRNLKYTWKLKCGRNRRDALDGAGGPLQQGHVYQMNRDHSPGTAFGENTGKGRSSQYPHVYETIPDQSRGKVFEDEARKCVDINLYLHDHDFYVDDDKMVVNVLYCSS